MVFALAGDSTITSFDKRTPRFTVIQIHRKGHLLGLTIYCTQTGMKKQSLYLQNGFLNVNNFRFFLEQCPFSSVLYEIHQSALFSFLNIKSVHIAAQRRLVPRHAVLTLWQPPKALQAADLLPHTIHRLASVQQLRLHTVLPLMVTIPSA